MQFLRMISPLSWMPIAVMAFGVGDDPVYFLLAFAAVWPIVLNTAAGVHHLDPLAAAGASVAATRWETLCHVILPGVLGHIPPACWRPLASCGSCWCPATRATGWPIPN